MRLDPSESIYHNDDMGLKALRLEQVVQQELKKAFSNWKRGASLHVLIYVQRLRTAAGLSPVSGANVHSAQD